MTSTAGGTGYAAGGISVAGGISGALPSLADTVLREHLNQNPAYQDAVSARLSKDLQTYREGEFMKACTMEYPPYPRDTQKRISLDRIHTSPGSFFLDPNDDVYLRGDHTWDYAGKVVTITAVDSEDQNTEVIVKIDGIERQYQWVNGAGWQLNFNYNPSYKMRFIDSFMEKLDINETPFFKEMPDTRYWDDEEEDTVADKPVTPTKRVRIATRLMHNVILEVPYFDNRDGDADIAEQRYVGNQIIDLKARLYNHGIAFKPSSVIPEQVEAQVEVSDWQGGITGDTSLGFWQENEDE